MWGADAFGGNGTGSGNCVQDGRFANYTLHIGPENEDTDYCLRRAWDTEMAVANANSTSIDMCNSYNTYYPWADCVSNIPHKGVHTYIGGVVSIYLFLGDMRYRADASFLRWPTSSRLLVIRFSSCTICTLIVFGGCGRSRILPTDSTISVARILIIQPMWSQLADGKIQLCITSCLLLTSWQIPPLAIS